MGCVGLCYWVSLCMFFLLVLNSVCLVFLCAYLFSKEKEIKVGNFVEARYQDRGLGGFGEAEIVIRIHCMENFQ